MRCPTEKQISSLVDGEVTESEAAVLREHIRQCSHCERTLDTMVRLNAALGSMRPELDSESLARRVKTRINEEREKAAGGMLLPLWARVALVTALVTIAVGLGNAAGTRMSHFYSQNPQEHVLEQLVAASNPGFASVVMDFGTQETAQ